MDNFTDSYEYNDDGTLRDMRLCDAPGCKERGEHKAPKCRDNEREYYWFCLDHVREYNKRWDYFNGMGREEIESFMRDAETGHRPTWKTTQRIPPVTDDLQRAVGSMFGGGFVGDGKNTIKQREIDPKLHKALAVLDMDYPVTVAELKRQYKKLVKKYHPDSTRSGKNSEDTFKNITQAYKEAMKFIKREEG